MIISFCHIFNPHISTICTYGMCSSNSKGKQDLFIYFYLQRRILRNISRQITCSLYRVMQKPVPGENLTKSRSFYCMNLVSFYKDDMLPLVLRSLNIFRSVNTFLSCKAYSFIRLIFIIKQM